MFENKDEVVNTVECALYEVKQEEKGFRQKIYEHLKEKRKQLVSKATKILRASQTKHFLRSIDELVPQRLSTDGNNVFS